MGFKLFWDGACSADRIKTYYPKGIDGFVLGTTLLFGKVIPYCEIIHSIREMNFYYYS
jgi:ribulose-phosphate 3-epimerase